MAFNFGGGAFGSSRNSTSGINGSNAPGLPGALPTYQSTYDDTQLNAKSQYELALRGQNLGKDESLRQIDLAKRGQDLNFQSAQLPWQFKRDVFNQTLPLIKGLDLSGGGSLDFGRVGGENTPLPGLPSPFIYSPGQVQENVNSARAQGDQNAAIQKRQFADSAAGRGFGAHSPFALAMNAGIGTATAASNADQERQIRSGAAVDNAGQGNTAASLATQQWNFQNQADIARRQAVADNMLNLQRNSIALVQALSSMG